MGLDHYGAYCSVEGGAPTRIVDTTVIPVERLGQPYVNSPGDALFKAWQPAPVTSLQRSVSCAPPSVIVERNSAVPGQPTARWDNDLPEPFLMARWGSSSSVTFEGLWEDVTKEPPFKGRGLYQSVNGGLPVRIVDSTEAVPGQPGAVFSWPRGFPRKADDAVAVMAMYTGGAGAVGVYQWVPSNGLTRVIDEASTELGSAISAINFFFEGFPVFGSQSGSNAMLNDWAWIVFSAWLVGPDGQPGTSDDEVNVYLAKPKLPGDFDLDGDVDVTDAAFVQGCFSGSGNPPSPGCEPADLDGDNDVDVADYLILQSNYTGTRC